MKTLLLHVQDDPGMEARLQAALSIARATSGHVSCLHITPISLYIASDGITGAYMMPNLSKVLDDMEKKMRARIEGHLENEDVSWSYEHVDGDPAQEIVSRSSLADLIVLGRYHHRETRHTPITLIGDVLQSCRAPILVQPQELDSFDVFGPAVVGWNGSFEAANALRAALPLLKMASMVHIVTVEEPQEHMLPSLSASTYLSRHGVTSELHTRPVSDKPVEDAIRETAAVMGASYIVMGGYGHSRAREFLFGGVTRTLLKECPIPLIMGR
ncbi:MAG: universal stress protein [Sphingorhabdus sp.]|jgi:nucleotide-binding universal stress UspA family protein|uniref:universal stress protein n=1 Tax=Sphingorhabdus sp. TaxID=1902408 RepID=UPI0025F924B8|nr:universal stress protein [Sphingorhabdus sp.]MCO4091746.1 universal stress protein [Sphingorhabdus sp.]